MSGRGASLRLVDVDGIPTRVLEAGQGEPLVLVHGGDFGSAYSLESWEPVVPLLAERFRVIAFDKLGQGHTSPPLRDEDYSVEGLLAHARGVLRELGLGPAHLVGHSMGAFLAARLVLDDPGIARSLVVVDSNTLAPDDERHPWRRFYRELAERMPPGPSEASVRLEPEAQSVSAEHVTPAFVAALLANARLPSLREAKARRDALLETTWLPSLQPARERTVAELAERGAPRADARRVGRRRPVRAAAARAAPLRDSRRGTARAELHVIARAGHYVFREQPARFAEVVSGFCSSA